MFLKTCAILWLETVRGECAPVAVVRRDIGKPTSAAATCHVRGAATWDSRSMMRHAEATRQPSSRGSRATGGLRTRRHKNHSINDLRRETTAPPTSRRLFAEYCQVRLVPFGKVPTSPIFSHDLRTVN